MTTHQKKPAVESDDVPEKSHDDFIRLCLDALKNSGFRITKPRRAVIDCLSRSEVPLSPRAIYESVREAPDAHQIDQVSVYRILDTLQNLGAIHQVFPSGDYLRCHDLTSPHPEHAMLQCERCGRASEVHLSQDLMTPLTTTLAAKNSFSVRSVVLQIKGICGVCSSPKKSG